MADRRVLFQNFGDKQGKEGMVLTDGECTAWSIVNTMPRVRQDPR